MGIDQYQKDLVASLLMGGPQMIPNNSKLGANFLQLAGGRWQVTKDGKLIPSIGIGPTKSITPYDDPSLPQKPRPIGIPPMPYDFY